MIFKPLYSSQLWCWFLSTIKKRENWKDRRRRIKTSTRHDKEDGEERRVYIFGVLFCFHSRNVECRSLSFFSVSSHLHHGFYAFNRRHPCQGKWTESNLRPSSSWANFHLTIRASEHPASGSLTMREHLFAFLKVSCNNLNGEESERKKKHIWLTNF